MTHLAHEVRVFLVERILVMMREAARRQDEDPATGPACSRFFLRQRQDVSCPPPAPLLQRRDGPDIGLAELERLAEEEVARRKARFEVARVVAAWEIEDGEVREANAEDHAERRPGQLRGELHENAIVDFWTEAAAGLVHVDWIFGPAHGLGHSFKVSRRNGGVKMEEIGVRWET